MRTRRFLMALLVLGCGETEPDVEPPTASEPIVLTDGRLDEWTSVPVLLADPADADPGSAVDLGEVRLSDDPEFLHLTIGLGRPVNPQRMRGTLSLVFDADGDAATGGEAADLAGVDVIFELSLREGSPRPSYGSGVGLRPVGSGGPQELRSAYDAGFVIAPTVSASHFELRLNRGFQIASGPPLFAGETLVLKLVFEDDTGVRDTTAAAVHTLGYQYRESDLLFRPEAVITKAEGVFRVVQWNVAGEGVKENPEPFQRVLAALEPDILLLDEVFGPVSPADLESFFGAPPLATLGPWRFVLGRSGGRQKNVVASRLPIRPEESLLDLRYPSEDLTRLSVDHGDPEFQELLEYERSQGIAAAGARVTLDGQDVLFVPFDLLSGGHDGSPRDRLRELQAKVLNGRVADALATSGAEPLSVVLGGDLNPVGSARPLDILRAGLDAGADLRVVEAFRLRDRSQATWRDVERGPFTPGRLDFLLFSTSSLTLERAFIFDANPHATDLAAASNHLPTVGDFRRRP